MNENQGDSITQVGLLLKECLSFGSELTKKYYDFIKFNHENHTYNKRRKDRQEDNSR